MGTQSNYSNCGVIERDTAQLPKYINALSHMASPLQGGAEQILKESCFAFIGLYESSQRGWLSCQSEMHANRGFAINNEHLRRMKFDFPAMMSYSQRKHAYSNATASLLLLDKCV